MQLTKEEESILNGSQGEVMAKMMKTMVSLGDIFGAKRMVDVTHDGHLVTSMGIPLLKPVFRTMQEIIDAGITAKWKFTADPRPIDYKNVKCNILDKLVFSKIKIVLAGGCSAVLYFPTTSISTLNRYKNFARLKCITHIVNFWTSVFLNQIKVQFVLRFCTNGDNN